MMGLFFLGALCAASGAWGRDSLGVFESWGAFRDPKVPRCYAIAVPQPSRSQRDFEPFATIGTWPRQNLRGQVHFRLSRQIAARSAIVLQVDSQRFRMTGGGGDAWAEDRAMDAAIAAAIRSATRMTIRASDKRGRRFSSTYSLAGAATAMDAATLACARSR